MSRARHSTACLLMLVPEYLRPLIRIGEFDAEARLDEIAAFLTD